MKIKCPCCKSEESQNVLLKLHQGTEFFFKTCQNCGSMFMPKLEGINFKFIAPTDQFLTNGYDLRVRRDALGLTSKQVCDAIGLGSATLSKIETNKMKPIPDYYLERLNECYNKFLRQELETNSHE